MAGYIDYADLAGFVQRNRTTCQQCVVLINLEDKITHPINNLNTAINDNPDHAEYLTLYKTAVENMSVKDVTRAIKYPFARNGLDIAERLDNEELGAQLWTATNTISDDVLTITVNIWS